MYNQKKIMPIIKKIFIGILNVACICLCSLLTFYASFIALLVAASPTGIWIAWTLVLWCFFLVVLFCAAIDLIMITRLKRNPYDEKARRAREKDKKLFWVIIILHICLCMFLFRLRL